MEFSLTDRCNSRDPPDLEIMRQRLTWVSNVVILFYFSPTENGNIQEIKNMIPPKGRVQ